MSDMVEKIWLKGLNPEQRLGAQSRGNVCIVARAGTGKTKGLVARVVDQIIGENKPESRIIMFTFTNLAANEMRKRLVNAHCPIPYYIGTFHKVCNKLMHDFPDLYGNRSSKIIFLDELGTKNFIRDNIITAITPEDRNEMLEVVGGEENFPKTSSLINNFADIISSLKSCVISSNDIKNNVVIPKWIKDKLNKSEILWMMLDKYYALYERLMNEKNLMDFDDMINVPLSVLENSEKIREYVSSHFDTILVDEHQDSSLAQVRLINALSKYAELYTVGDDGQSIYGWRGADVSFIRNRTQEKNVQNISLFRNYRSTSNILNLANIVLSYDYNVSDVRIEASGQYANRTTRPCITAYNYVTDEIIGVSKGIEKLITQGENPSDIAVLSRSRSMASQMGNQLAKDGIAFKSSEFSLWESRDVKFIMTLLAIAHDKYHVGNIALLHNICEGPIKTGIAKAGIKKIHLLAEQDGFWNALISIAKKNKNPSLGIIVSTIEKIEHYKNSLSLDILIDIAFCDSGLQEQIEREILEVNKLLQQMTFSHPQRGKLEDERDVLNNRINRIKSELIEASENIGYEELALQSVIGGQSRKIDNQDAVKILTIHSAKGLEFKHVFIIGCTDSNMGTADKDSEDFGESCRVLYVAITRAEQTLELSYSHTMYGKPQNMCHLFDDVDEKILKKNKTPQRTSHFYN